MLEKGELASTGTVEQSCHETAMIGAHVGSIIMKNNPFRYTKIKNDCIGILGEVAVLGLAQRFSVKHGLTDCWQASSSLIGDDRGKVRRGAIRDGWDIDVWSKLDDRLPELSYRVRVKSSNYLVKSYREGIQVVSISPDLALADNEQTLLGLRIVQELNNEQSGAGSRNRISRVLNRRTEKLLDALER